MLTLNLLQKPPASQRRLIKQADRLWDHHQSRSFGDMINQYALRLKLLHTLGFLRGRILYPMMGNDILPGFFGHLIGLNTEFGLGTANDTDTVVSIVREHVLMNDLDKAFLTRTCHVEPICCNVIDIKDYKKELATADVLLIKGFKAWSSQTPRYWVRKPHQLIELITEKMKPGSKIIIMGRKDEEFGKMLLTKPNFTDGLKQPDIPETVYNVLSYGGHEQYIPCKSLQFLAGSLPVMVITKTNSAIHPQLAKQLSSEQLP